MAVEFQTEYLIVGAGASGAAAAWRLASKGASVTVLDRGPEMDPSTYPTTSYDWEKRKRKDFSPVASLRNNFADYPLDDSDSPIAVCNYNAVGGSTILYSGHFPRFLRKDFSIFSEEGLGHDWPINYDSLLPYFAINEQQMGASGLVGDPFYPEIDNLLPPVPLGAAGARLAEGFNKLGWHWWPSLSAISTREHKDRARCINLGPCNTGCPQGAKASVDITYIKRAKLLGTTVKSNFAVASILVDGDKAIGARGFTSEGKEQYYYANKVILASSAVGTPRILLNSKSNLFPNGLANSSGLVGKNLMIHPLGYVEGLFKQYLGTDSGPQGCMLYSLEHYRSREENQHKLGYMMHALRGAGPVEVANSVYMRRKLKLGQSVYADFLKHYGKQLVISIICEDLPEKNNRVTLDPNKVDRFGVNGVKIHYKLSDNSKSMLSHGMGKARSLMAAAGADKSFAYGPVRNTGWHIMGTCKMGVDPNTSVVNTKGEAHDVKNLHIIDASIFPTSSCVNPANTIQSLALLLVDRIYEGSLC